MRSGRRLKAEHVRDYGIVVFVIGIFVYFSLASPVFLTSGNLLNLVYSNAIVGIPACAVTLTIIAGNFDLSLGAIFTLTEVLCAWAAVHWGVWWCFPIAIVAGALMGLVNGAIITKLRVNAFLATLATALAFTGLALAVSGGFEIIPLRRSVFTFIGQHKVGGIQYPDLILLVVAILLQLVLAFTVFGRHLYGVGGNRDAARLSGLKVDRIVIITFVLTGAACGLAGLIDASTTGQGSAIERPRTESRPPRDRRSGARRHEHLRRRRRRLADDDRRADARDDHQRLRPARGRRLLAADRPWRLIIGACIGAMIERR